MNNNIIRRPNRCESQFGESPISIIYDFYSREMSPILQELHSLNPTMADKSLTGDPYAEGMIGLSLDPTLLGTTRKK